MTLTLDISSYAMASRDSRGTRYLTCPFLSSAPGFANGRCGTLSRERSSQQADERRPQFVIVSELKRRQTSWGNSRLLDSTDSNLPLVTIRSYSQSNRRPRFKLGADRNSSSDISTPRNPLGKASTMEPLRETEAGP